MVKSDIIVGRKYQHGKNFAIYLGIGENINGKIENKNLVCISNFANIPTGIGNETKRIEKPGVGTIVSDSAGLRFWGNFKLIESY